MQAAVVHRTTAHQRRQAAELVHRQFCLGEALDVFVVHPAFEIGMDEAVELTELELQRAAHLACRVDPAHLTNDLGRMVKITLMVVGQVIDEQVIEVEGGLHLSVLN